MSDHECMAIAAIESCLGLAVHVSPDRLTLRDRDGDSYGTVARTDRGLVADAERLARRYVDSVLLMHAEVVCGGEA